MNRVDPMDFGNYFFRLLDEGKESSAAEIMAQPLVLARIPNSRRMGIYSIILRNKNPSEGFMMSITNEHMIKWIPGEVWGSILIRYLELEMKQALWLLQNPAIIQTLPEESIGMISRHLKDFPLADSDLLAALVSGPLRYKFSPDTWMTVILKYLFLGNTESAAFLLGQQDLVARFPEEFKLRLLILRAAATHGRPPLEIKTDALRILEDIATRRRQTKPVLEPRPLLPRPDLPKPRKFPRFKPKAVLQPAVLPRPLPQRPVRLPSGMSSFSGQLVKGLSHF
jgi:hypothetical protein